MQNNFYYDIIKSAARSGSAFYVFWPRGQAVKTSPFHGGNTGSIPVGVSSHGQRADYKSAARSEYVDAAQFNKIDCVNRRQRADYKSEARNEYADAAQFNKIDCVNRRQSADYKSEARNEYADVAQLAEQLICNQQVIGSSPIIGFVPGGTVIIADL